MSKESNIRVLFLSRKTLFSVPGGDTTQMLKTKEYLEKKGVKVDISTELEPDLKKYDLVHLFNLTRPQELYLQILNAKKQNKKVVLSTIYVVFTEFEKKRRTGLIKILTSVLSANTIELLKIFMRAVKNREFHKGTLELFKTGYKKTLKKILSESDILLPNSESEMKRLRKDFNLTNPLYVNVPNAVDSVVFDEDKVTVDKAAKYQDCILCVARIEGRKEQLNLVKAMKDLPYTLVLVGKPAPNHLNYYEEVKRNAGKNVVFIDHLDHHDLPEYYKVAKVHALISWMETTGLSSLEAGVMGCNLVITNKGDTYDYFGELAYYCEPDNIESIKKALIQAYEAPVNPQLKKHILANYTWDITAQKTLEAYKMIK